MKRKQAAASSEYEQLRLARMQENKKRLMELGLLDIKASISEDVRQQKKPHRRRLSCDVQQKESQRSQQQQQPLPSRRSSRIQNLPAPSYKDAFERACGQEERGRGRNSRKVALRAGAGGPKPEVYTEEHEKLLGDAQKEWIMFKDGYDDKGERIYDPVNGKTCHQCRQKTLGLRTVCSVCQIVQGQFCGDCLYMRYGENVKEALQDEEWKCPVCRDICNCSVCRNKKGWTPTGQLYKTVLELGYKSVAHYLIMTRRSAPIEQNENEEKDEQDDPRMQEDTSNDEGEVLDPIVSKEPKLEVLVVSKKPEEEVLDPVVSKEPHLDIIVLSDGESDDTEDEKPAMYDEARPMLRRVQPRRSARLKSTKI